MQYRLLRHGIESAPLTTDAGIDLVAYSPVGRRPVTIQVKTNLQAKPAGGTGKPALNWTLRVDSPAELVALVDLATEQVWLMTIDSYADTAQQKSSSGKYNLYMYIDSDVKPRGGHDRVLAADFDEFVLEASVAALFGIPTTVADVDASA